MRYEVLTLEVHGNTIWHVTDRVSGRIVLSYQDAEGDRFEDAAAFAYAMEHQEAQ